MKWIIPATIIGLVGGVLNTVTDLHKVWCFLIGVAAFIVLLFIHSVIKTAKIMRKTKGAKKIWIDRDNNLVGME